MNGKKIIISGIAAGITIFIVTFIVDALIQFIAPYDVLSLAGMRAVTDPVMTLFFAYPFVIGFALAILYDVTRAAFTGSVKDNGIKLGLLGWVVGSIPSAYVVYTSMMYPIGFTLSSIVGTLLYMLAAGLVVARLSR